MENRNNFVAIGYHLPVEICEGMGLKTDVGNYKYLFKAYWVFARMYSLVLLGAPFVKYLAVAVNRVIYKNMYHYLLQNNGSNFGLHVPNKKSD